MNVISDYWVFQGWNFIFERGRPFSFCKRHIYILKSFRNHLKQHYSNARHLYMFIEFSYGGGGGAHIENKQAPSIVCFLIFARKIIRFSLQILSLRGEGHFHFAKGTYMLKSQSMRNMMFEGASRQPF